MHPMTTLRGSDPARSGSLRFFSVGQADPGLTQRQSGQWVTGQGSFRTRPADPTRHRTRTRTLGAAHDIGVTHPLCIAGGRRRVHRAHDPLHVGDTIGALHVHTAERPTVMGTATCIGAADAGVHDPLRTIDPRCTAMRDMSSTGAPGGGDRRDESTPATVDIVVIGGAAGQSGRRCDRALAVFPRTDRACVVSRALSRARHERPEGRA